MVAWAAIGKGLASGARGVATAGRGVRMGRSIFRRKDNKQKGQPGQQGQDIAAEQEIERAPRRSKPTTSLVPDRFSSSPKNIDKASVSAGSTETLEGTTIRIKTSLVQVDNLLKDSLVLEKVREGIRKEEENAKRRGKEEEKEKPKIKGINLKKFVPKPVKSLWDRIVQWVVAVFTGWILRKMVDNIPALEGFLTLIGNVGNWLIDMGGKLFDGLVTFIDWSYSLYDGFRDWIGKKFGSDALESFDNLMGVMNKVLNGVLIAMGVVLKIAMTSMAASAGGPWTGQVLKQGGKKLITTQGGKAVSTAAARRYALKYGKKAAIKKFGKVGVKALGGKLARSGATNLARKGLVALLKGRGLKTFLKFTRRWIAPWLERIPLIGALISFALDFFVFKEPLGRAAFGAIGAGLGTWLGGILGSIVPIVGTAVGAFLGGWGGSELGKAIYDMVFGKAMPETVDEEVQSEEQFDELLKTEIDAYDKKEDLDEKDPRKGANKAGTGSSATGGEIGALLDTIAFAEGTAHMPNSGYNTHFGHSQTADLSRHPAKIITKGGYSSDAFGRYQFLSTTWGNVGGGAMTPERQDWGATRLVLMRLGLPQNKAGAKQLEKMLQTNGLSGGLVDKLAPEWASFPTLATGTSYYGQGGKSLTALQAEYMKRLKSKGSTRSGDLKTADQQSSEWSDIAHLPGEASGKEGHVDQIQSQNLAGMKAGKPKKIYLHWTAGGYNSVVGPYHTIFTGDGTMHRRVDYNKRSGHTYNRNSNSVGLSVAAMSGGSGNYRWPTKKQLEAMTGEAARLGKAWGWNSSDVTIKNIMTHGEAGSNRDGRVMHDNYGPSLWGGTGERWDLDKLRASQKIGQGGPELRKMIASKIGGGGGTDRKKFLGIFHKGREVPGEAGEEGFGLLQAQEEVIGAKQAEIEEKISPGFFDRLRGVNSPDDFSDVLTHAAYEQGFQEEIIVFQAPSETSGTQSLSSGGMMLGGGSGGGNKIGKSLYKS